MVQMAVACLRESSFANVLLKSCLECCLQVGLL
uniref:Uncharacterized protein n=1 Tax=Arundo donax TaxID=35708 RepID=A0A0A8Y7E4_ARUDO